MKYIVSTAGYDYPNEEDRIRLGALGFTFTENYYIRGTGMVEINTLEELNEFINEHGEIVINLSEITIYDYYLE